MRLTWRDAWASLLVAAILIPYVGYEVRGSMPFIDDARGMAGAALLLGAVAWLVGQRIPDRDEGRITLVTLIGLGLVVLGCVAVWIESDLLLTAFVVSIVAVWAVALLLHAGALHSGPSS